MFGIISTWIASRLAGAWTKLALVAGVVLAILTAALRLIAIGRQQERAARDKANLEAVKKRDEVRDEVNGMGDSHVADELAQWMRDRK